MSLMRGQARLWATEDPGLELSVPGLDLVTLVPQQRNAESPVGSAPGPRPQASGPGVGTPARQGALRLARRSRRLGRLRAHRGRCGGAAGARQVALWPWPRPRPGRRAGGGAALRPARGPGERRRARERRSGGGGGRGGSGWARAGWSAVAERRAAAARSPPCRRGSEAWRARAEASGGRAAPVAPRRPGPGPMSGGLGLRRSPEMSGKIEKAGEARARGGSLRQGPARRLRRSPGRARVSRDARPCVRRGGVKPPRPRRDAWQTLLQAHSLPGAGGSGRCGDAGGRAGRGPCNPGPGARAAPRSPGTSENGSSPRQGKNSPGRVLLRLQPSVPGLGSALGR